MPDDRLFHKRLGHSDKVTGLTDFEYVVWTSYVLSADDFGVMRFSAIALQSDHDRLAAKPSKAVQRALEQLRTIHLLETFKHQGREYAFQGDWQDWQHVEYPRATIHPRPDDASLLRCTDATRKLFDAHPGGWRGKKRPKVSDTPSEGVGNVLPTPLETPDRKPLAVSRKPLAVSQEPVRAARGVGAGVMAGSLPRDHMNCHQPCIRVCISEKQHAILRERHGGSDADMDAFYADVRASLTAPVGETPWNFWQAQFTARFGTSAAVNPRTAGNAAAAAAFVARGQR